jgi:hypothetical protein
MPRRALLLLLPLLAACRPEPGATPQPSAWRLLEPPLAQGWKPAGIPDEGGMEIAEGVLTVRAGQPMTGAVFTVWEKAGLPATGYAVTYEAMRVEGEDIFGMATFPVGSHESHATFVLGGWGGTVTGISSIDFKDASENQTRGEQVFENGRWHQVRLEVRSEDLRAWVNGRPAVNASIKGRKVTLRPGFIDHCVPFGFATWGTTGKIRNVEVRRL